MCSPDNHITYGSPSLTYNKTQKCTYVHPKEYENLPIVGTVCFFLESVSSSCLVISVWQEPVPAILKEGVHYTATLIAHPALHSFQLLQQVPMRLITLRSTYSYTQRPVFIRTCDLVTCKKWIYLRIHICMYKTYVCIQISFALNCYIIIRTY